MSNNKRSKEKSTKKGEWINPLLTRVALNPEQAVLSCCDSLDRMMNGSQCEEIACGGTALYLTSS
ncbi:MAG: hypothetical protein PHP69_04130 [Candidatus Omnitrophica bacterium]|nr:hypothetical protein [Candidatus Omnitrophota bacterium]MDD5080555.1 hypothetical protein [Candidatus Omnitrophota bacterium]MDD5441283.1 hypothetical protein [Candidatus Omnitrophota bacterium]